MSYKVYVIRSLKNNILYVGLTNSISRRLKEHNSGYNKSTKAFKPYQLVYQERFKSRKEARQREKYLKSGVGKEWLKLYAAGWSSSTCLPAGRARVAHKVG